MRSVYSHSVKHFWNEAYTEHYVGHPLKAIYVHYRVICRLIIYLRCCPLNRPTVFSMKCLPERFNKFMLCRKHSVALRPKAKHNARRVEQWISLKLFNMEFIFPLCVHQIQLSNTIIPFYSHLSLREILKMFSSSKTWKQSIRPNACDNTSIQFIARWKHLSAAAC